MKYLLLIIFLTSNIVFAGESYCNSSAGQASTLMKTNEAFSDTQFNDIRMLLFKKCGDLEKQGAPIEKISKELSSTCYTFIENKMSGAQVAAKYRRACDLGSFASDSYIEGIKVGKKECNGITPSPAASTPTPNAAAR